MTTNGMDFQHAQRRLPRLIDEPARTHFASSVVVAESSPSLQAQGDCFTKKKRTSESEIPRSTHENGDPSSKSRGAQTRSTTD